MDRISRRKFVPAGLAAAGSASAGKLIGQAAPAAPEHQHGGH